MNTVGKVVGKDIVQQNTAFNQGVQGSLPFGVVDPAKTRQIAAAKKEREIETIRRRLIRQQSSLDTLG